MAMEVVCGNCQGRLRVEQTGVIVACPHCGAHLQIGDPAPPVPVPAVAEAPPSIPPPPEPSFPPPVFTPDVAVSPSPFTFEPPPVSFPPAVPPPVEILPEIILTPPPKEPQQVSAVDITPGLDTPPNLFAPPVSTDTPLSDSDTWMPKINLSMPPKIDAPALPALDEASTLLLPPATPGSPPPAAPQSPPLPAQPNNAEGTDIWKGSQIEHTFGEQSTLSMPGSPRFEGFPQNPSETSSSTASTLVMPGPGSPMRPEMMASTKSESPAAPTAATSDSSREAVVPRYLFVIVASYASAITLAFLYLWWRGTVSTIDLPDVVPKINKQTGKIGMTLLQETQLPPAYRLKIGESKRYGSLLVTPVKVTKSPLEFVYFTENGPTKPPSSTPVLKLWVKFKNVSSDQTFPALDEQLLFRRTGDKENATQDRTNNYVCLQSERKRLGKRVPVYTLPINGDWLLKGQNLNTPIGPDQEWQTYIPTNDEDLSSLKGPLTWRLHFRKGYNPQTFHGVTTLVEVEFDSQDIRAES